MNGSKNAPRRTVVSTNHLPEKDRFEFWREVVLRHYTNVRLERMTNEPFFGKAEMYEFGEVSFGTVHSVAQYGFIDRPEKALYAVNLQLAGTSIGMQGDDEWVVRPGGIDWIDTTQKAKMGMSDESRSFIVLVPRHLLRPPFKESSAVSGTRLSRKHFATKLVTALMSRFAFQKDFAEPNVDRMLAALLNVMEIALATPPDAKWQPEIFSRDTLYWMICDCINGNLNKKLSPEWLAAFFQISKRALYKLFEEFGESTPMEFVWMQRLEHCKEDLANPDMSTRSITDIWGEWGFSNSQHFSNAFKRAYRKSPRAWRAESIQKKKGNNGGDGSGT